MDGYFHARGGFAESGRVVSRLVGFVDDDPDELLAAAFDSTALLAANPTPTEDEIRIGLSGNLCRCTGYDGIIKAVAQAAAD